MLNCSLVLRFPFQSAPEISLLSLHVHRRDQLGKRFLHVDGLCPSKQQSQRELSLDSVVLRMEVISLSATQRGTNDFSSGSLPIYVLVSLEISLADVCNERQDEKAQWLSFALPSM